MGRWVIKEKELGGDNLDKSLEDPCRMQQCRWTWWQWEVEMPGYFQCEDAEGLQLKKR